MQVLVTAINWSNNQNHFWVTEHYKRIPTKAHAIEDESSHWPGSLTTGLSGVMLYGCNQPSLVFLSWLSFWS